MQIMVLEKSNNDWRARELSEAELTEHRQAVSAAEGTLRNFRVSFQEPQLEPADEPPMPNQTA